MTSHNKLTLVLAVDCVYSEWSDYGVCSHSCGEGNMFRYRYMSRPYPMLLILLVTSKLTICLFFTFTERLLLKEKVMVYLARSMNSMKAQPAILGIVMTQPVSLMV